MTLAGNTTFITVHVYGDRVRRTRLEDPVVVYHRSGIDLGSAQQINRAGIVRRRRPGIHDVVEADGIPQIDGDIIPVQNPDTDTARVLHDVMRDGVIIRPMQINPTPGGIGRGDAIDQIAAHQIVIAVVEHLDPIRHGAIDFIAGNRIVTAVTEPDRRAIIQKMITGDRFIVRVRDRHRGIAGRGIAGRGIGEGQTAERDIRRPID